MKITVICRVEPGCLGPDGIDHVDEFCLFAQKEFDLLDTQIIDWKITPRTDKILDEIQYKLKGRFLSGNQAQLYLNALGRKKTDFEDILFSQLSQSVNNYFKR
mgnify:FL=1